MDWEKQRKVMRKMKNKPTKPGFLQHWNSIKPMKQPIDARKIAEEFYHYGYKDALQQRTEMLHDIYLAGPLFSLAEKSFNAKLCSFLRDNGFSVFLPQEGAGNLSPKQIFDFCKKGVEQARSVLAILDGPDADSGTSWESGYAVGKGIPVIGVRTDFRRCEEKHVNLMLHYGVDVIIVNLLDDETKLFREILAALQRTLGPTVPIEPDIKTRLSL